MVLMAGTCGLAAEWQEQGGEGLPPLAPSPITLAKPQPLPQWQAPTGEGAGPVVQ